MTKFRIIWLFAPLSLIYILISVLWVGEVQAKTSCWRISEGDLPKPIVLSRGDCGMGLGYGSAPQEVVVRILDEEIYYRLITTDADGQSEGRDEGPWWGWKYYPATPRHQAIMIGSIPMADMVDPNGGPEPDSLTKGGEYRVHAPSKAMESALNRHILLGKRGLITDRPARFAVISEATRFLGGNIQLTSNDGREIDLTKRYGDQLWDLLAGVQLSSRFNEEPPVEAGHSLKILTRGDTPVSLRYYPRAEGRPALIANDIAIRFTPADLYEVPERLEEVLEMALSPNADTKIWVRPIVFLSVVVAFGAAMMVLLSRIMTRLRRVMSKL